MKIESESTHQQVEFVILKPNDAAERLRCSSAQIYKLSKSGLLPHVRIGRNIGILESDLVKFIVSNRYPKPKGSNHVR